MLQESQKDNYKQDIHSKSEPYVFTHDHPFLLLCLCLLSPLNIKSHLALVCFAETTVFVTHSLPMRTVALQIITLMVYNRASFYYLFFLYKKGINIHFYFSWYRNPRGEARSNHIWLTTGTVNCWKTEKQKNLGSLSSVDFFFFFLIFFMAWANDIIIWN